ncbi:MAG TPA: glycosyltransferase, partial [Chloroflexota bacterium]
GFGMPALEALACGAPLIVGNRGSLPEVAADAALIVDPLDVGSIATALERIVGEGGLRTELRERGLRRAAGFDWSTAAGITRRALEQAFRAGAGTPPPSPPPSAAN